MYTHSQILQLRADALNCGPGSKACGGRCIPQDQNCNLTTKAKNRMGNAAGAAKSAAGSAYRKAGNAVTGAAIGAGVAHGVAKKAVGSAYGKAKTAAGSAYGKVKGAVRSGVNRAATAGYNASNKAAGAAMNKMNSTTGQGRRAQATRSVAGAAYRGASSARNKFKKLRRDQAIRLDRTLKCSPGNKQCGNRCIPQESTCRKNSARKRAAIGGGVGAAVAAGAMAFRGRRSSKKAAVPAPSPAAIAAQARQAKKQARNASLMVKGKKMAKIGAAATVGLGAGATAVKARTAYQGLKQKKANRQAEFEQWEDKNRRAQHGRMNQAASEDIMRQQRQHSNQAKFQASVNASVAAQPQKFAPKVRGSGVPSNSAIVVKGRNGGLNQASAASKSSPLQRLGNMAKQQTTPEQMGRNLARAHVKGRQVVGQLTRGAVNAGRRARQATDAYVEKSQKGKRQDDGSFIIYGRNSQLAY